MLSILIPIYNFNVVKLVKELVQQCRKEAISFEVVCYDDCSKEKFKLENRDLAGTVGVSYLELSENYGRSKIRNTLAKTARYENLLFLDCDSKIINSRFIKNYIQALQKGKVINGGRVYKAKKPRSLKKQLHWKYGSKRESLSHTKRDKKGISSFHTNNFIIPRELALRFPFATYVSGYGYEDVAFADQLKKSNVQFVNIKNPVEHVGIVTSQIFLEKTLEALYNLKKLDDTRSVEEVKLIRTYKKLKNWGWINLLDQLYVTTEQRILNNLLGKNPNLFLFDFYRLVQYSRIKKSDSTSSIKK